jgi:hypothetical protein
MRPAPDAAQQEQTVRSIKQFATAHLDRHTNLSCVQVATPTGTKTITVDFSATAHHGADPNANVSALLEEVFSTSNAAEFRFDHFGTIAGKPLAAYNYSFQLDGKVHAGVIYADETTGAISRIAFRGAEAPAHLFCTAR